MNAAGGTSGASRAQLDSPYGGDMKSKQASDDVGQGLGTSLIQAPLLRVRGDGEDHSQTMRRIFIGPMPRKRVVDETGDLDEVHYHDVIGHFLHWNGLNIFLKMGGRKEDWSADAENALRERLLERVNESLWTHAKKSGKAKRGGVTQGTEWVGTSFEVGEILGVRLMEKQPSASGEALLDDYTDEPPRTPPFQRNISSGIWSSPKSADSRSATIPENGRSKSPQSSSSVNDHSARGSNSSTAKFLSPPPTPRRITPQSNRIVNGPKPMTSTRSILSMSAGRNNKGKRRAVHYEDTRQEPTGALAPAPPGDVLARRPADVLDSSASAADAAAQTAAEADAMRPSGDIDIRDRMLVRVIHSQDNSLRTPFDEKACRSTRNLDYKEWMECLVIWRNQRIEIYLDYKAPWKERALGHKRLAFVIPLSAPTKLSVFSLVDFSFCLASRSTPVKSKGWLRRQWTLLRGDRGTDIFILKSRSRSRSADWVCRLWRQLGGVLPESLDVTFPLVNVRVKVYLSNDGEHGYLTRTKVVELCEEATANIHELNQLREQLTLQGNKTLELCWRSDARLEWVWLDDDIEGVPRHGAVSYGAVLQNLGVPVALELRLAEHYPTKVKQGDSVQMEEPSAIEGYVYIVRQQPKPRSLVYLSTHDGWLFSIQSTRGVPPPTNTSITTFMANGPSAFRKEEIRRQRTQILKARGFWDLRNVLLVRRAEHITPLFVECNVKPTLDADGHWVDDRGHVTDHWSELERSTSDEFDAVGDDALNRSDDKPRLKMHRAFELVFKSGHVIRFEAHSRQLNLEWITRLRQLVSYWNLRHRADARMEMNIIKESYGIDKITPGKLDQAAELPPDPKMGSQHLSTFWNWCVIDSCRAVLKSGKLFTKKRFLDQYVHSQLFLIAGHVATYRLSFQGTMHHQRSTSISLHDAYVCSGFYTARELPLHEYDPNAPTMARIYADGLETKNADEDIVFMLWYRPQAILARGDGNNLPIPKLSAKPKMLICRARSQLERDAWCWALNAEIERLARQTKRREEKARTRGMPIP